MADKPLPWFRLYPEMLADPKLKIAANSMDMNILEIIGAWISILCIAGSSPVRGSLYVTLQKRYSNRDIAGILTISEENTNKLMKLFIELDMLELDKSGGYSIKNWEKRQFESDNSTKRVQEWRNKQKENVTLQKRNTSVSVSDINSSLSTNYLRIFSGVTNMVAIPGNDGDVYNAIDQLANKYKNENELIDYLKPYFQKWIKTKSKEGKLYSKTNNAWLTKFAVAGEMPGEIIQSKSRQVFK